jgi:mannitol/fructose-specific phosphotransferase system IIA component (Ntr-type)
MKISDFLRKDFVEINLRSITKEEVLNEMVGLLAKQNVKFDKKETVLSLLRREELGSTGTYEGIAMPHSRTKGVTELYGILGVSRPGVDFDVPGDEKVHIIFLLLAPETATGLMLKAIACVCKFLINRDNRKKVLNAESAEEIMDIIGVEYPVRKID